MNRPQHDTDAVDTAIDDFARAPTAGARAKLRAVIDEYARGKLGDVAAVAHEATMALAARRLTGMSTLPAFVKMLRERGRTDAQLEAMLADVFEGVVTHLHTRGDPETSIHTCQAADITE